MIIHGMITEQSQDTNMEPIATQLEENQAAWADDELQESIRMQAAELAQLHVDGAQA